MNWYSLSLIVLFLYGIMYFLYKVSAEKRCNTAWTTFSSMTTVFVLSSIFFFTSGGSVINIRFLLLISLLNAVFFLATTIAQMEALKHVPTSITYPIVRLNTVIVVLFSIIYFKDNLSIYQIGGIILAIAAIQILTRQDKGAKIEHKNFRLGIILTIIAFLTAAMTTIITKFASVSVNQMAFIAVSYAYNSIFSISLRKKLQTEKENPRHRDAMIIGFFIGLLNFIGFYLILKIYAVGILSIAVPLIGLSFVISILLATWIYKEKLTLNKILGIILAIASIILLRP